MPKPDTDGWFAALDGEILDGATITADMASAGRIDVVVHVTKPIVIHDGDVLVIYNDRLEQIVQTVVQWPTQYVDKGQVVALTFPIDLTF